MDDSSPNEADEGRFENLERISSAPPALPRHVESLIELEPLPKVNLEALAESSMEVDSESWPSRLA